MTEMIRQAEAFFSQNLPSVRALVLGGPFALVWALGCLSLSGWLKVRHRWKTGYTRKLFHFLIFGSVVVVHGRWGVSGVCLFGAMTSLVIAYALWRGSGHLLYEALAREQDAPRQTYYIVAPYLATLLGGLFTNIFLSSTAVLGYLVTGLGDAIAEPIGTRFGRHPYRAPALTGVRAARSYEGSGAVFVASALSMAGWLALSPTQAMTAESMLMVTVIAGAATAVEALSPHGWDNATLQIIPAAMGALLL